MASTLREVCSTVRKFLESVPPERIGFPVGLDDPILCGVEAKKTTAHQPFKINRVRKAWGNSQLKGMLLRYPDSAEILYSVNLNPCWTRFVVCKEAAHLLIDTDSKHFTHNPVELIQQLLVGAPSLNSDDPFRSEQLATFAAIEMLAPWPLRPEITKMLEKGWTDLQIAKVILVPEDFVNYLVRSRYWEVSEQCHLAYKSGH